MWNDAKLDPRFVEGLPRVNDSQGSAKECDGECYGLEGAHADDPLSVSPRLVRVTGRIGADTVDLPERSVRSLTRPACSPRRCLPPVACGTIQPPMSPAGHARNFSGSHFTGLGAYTAHSIINAVHSMPRTARKTSVLTVRIEPEVKEMLGAAAKAERRSLANMLAVAVMAYCENRGIAAPSAPAPKSAARPRRPVRKPTRTK